MERVATLEPVVLVALDTYTTTNVYKALSRGLELLDPRGTLFVGDDVLIKPNLLVPAPPDSGVCTHPAVMAAIIDLVRERKAARVRVGDSPAVHSARAAARAAGILQVLEHRDVPLEEFVDVRWTPCPEGRVCRSFPVARQVLTSDALVSAARLKTHNLTRYSGATKNLYGCLVGMHKARLHLRYNRLEEFSRMLADLALLLRPRLSILDAVVSMEGAGPRSGELRHTGFVVISADPVTADALACRIVGLPPGEVLHLRYAAESGLGVLNPDEMCVSGADPEALGVSQFRVPPGLPATTWGAPAPLVNLVRRLFVPRPRVLSERCTGCSACAKICPASVITPGRPARIAQGDCISCFCCHEVCPEGAITLGRFGSH